MEKKNKDILIDFKPINFYMVLITVFIKVLLLLICSWGILFLLSNDVRKEYIMTHYSLTLFIFISFIFVTLLQTWFNGKVYIYSVIYSEGVIKMAWQERNSFKEASVPFESIKALLKPSDRNSLYLEIIIKKNGKSILLKQTYYPKWDRPTMKKFIDTLNGMKFSN